MTSRRSSGCGACVPELTIRRHHGRLLCLGSRAKASTLRGRHHMWAFCYLWAAGGHLTVESVGISVWWSDFSILQAFCKETQPDNLLAKYLEQFHEAPAII